MALVEHLIAQIPDAALRKAIEREVADLKKRLTWGLVFERHIPETTLLLDAPVRPGAVVWERRAAKPRRFRVLAIEGDEVLVVPEAEGEAAPADAEAIRLARDAVLVEKPFGEPVYPALSSLGAVRNGAADRPSHAVIEGENFHALQALLVAFEGQVDCVYLDPPYNTGARDWKYNNDFVDAADVWKHSKWLALMEKRLALVRRLLKRDGVLVVTIDEHEVHHLGMLIEQMFKDAYVQLITIVNNPKGVTQGRFSRVEEYAFFVFFGAAMVRGLGDDYLSPLTDEDEEEGARPRWKGLLRSGGDALREHRQKMFYPVLVDAERGAVVDVGEPLLEGKPDLQARVGNLTAVWPIRKDGKLGRWGVGPSTLRALIKQGYVSLGAFDAKRSTWAISYLSRQAQDQVASGVLVLDSFDEARNVVDVRYAAIAERQIKTVWHRTRHDAGAGGSDLLTAFLGRKDVFPFPKSVYSVRDTLAAVVRSRPDALVVDAFAGSGTTLHATMLLNTQDGGRRRCVLVTNNEVADEQARRLRRQEHFRGDPDYEVHGIFAAATRPRITAAVTGRRPDGAPVIGSYLDGVPYAEGFAENVEFFRLDYLDPIDVELGLRFEALLPLWWLQAGGVGERAPIDTAAAFALPAGSPYAFLFDPSGIPGLLAGLVARPDVTHASIVADTDEAFADLASQLPGHLTTTLLYRPYLDTVRGMRA